MDKLSLHEFYLSLIPNLVSELFFFIPKNEIREDIIEKLDFLETKEIFNKAYVVDYYQGPIEYAKGRSNKHFLLKEGYLEKNIFSLLEKKSEAKRHEFEYVLEKYFELAECLFYVTDWMNSHIVQLDQCNEDITGIFYFQSIVYKKYFEILIRKFFPSKEMIPKGNFNALLLVETYFPDILSLYNNPKKIPSGISKEFEKTQNKNMPQGKKSIKKPLVTSVEAEAILLKKIFNVDTTIIINSNFKHKLIS